jgi:hypothetical protein
MMTNLVVSTKRLLGCASLANTVASLTFCCASAQCHGVGENRQSLSVTVWWLTVKHFRGWSMVDITSQT